MNPPKSWSLKTLTKAFLVIVLLVLGVFLMQLGSFLQPTPPPIVLTISKTNSNSTSNSSYLVNTETCKIYKTNTIPTKPTGLELPKCSYEKALATLNDETQVLTLLPKFQNTTCCIQMILPKEMNDNRYTITECRPLKTSIDLRSHEMYIIRCGPHINFGANLNISREVDRKIIHWAKVAQEKLPVSVLVIGIDSVARSHAYRSLPKTIPYLKSLGFVDFKGYHSAGAGTSFNFAAFLQGWSRATMRKRCAPNRQSPFDPCPLIWGNFSEKNYVTMYIEDGHQSFNWGGQSGFKKRPTDYYIHSLFNSMETIRLNETYKHLKVKKRNNMNLEKYVYCPSNQSSPEYLMDYTHRFHSKFSKVPTFSFVFFENPFHDYVGRRILRNYDEHFMGFFQKLNSIPNFKRDTVVVLLSDHGRRGARSAQGSMEVSLPLFFIRVPENLLSRFPQEDILNSIKANSERLTSPYDLHRTFLHIASLSEFKASFRNEFESNFERSSSLLFPVSKYRGCPDVGFGVERCVCNWLPILRPEMNRSKLDKLGKFAVRLLNDKIGNSSYNGLCETWQLNMSEVKSNIFMESARHQNHILHFGVRPGQTRFEIKLKVSTDPSGEFGGIVPLGSFLRQDQYRNQSWCVGSKTDGDKDMESMCLCK